MEAREAIKKIERQAIIALDAEDLPMLNDAFDTIRADGTCVAGRIRILSLDGHILVQEPTPGAEVLVRRLSSRDSAEEFIEHRLASVVRMRDGCDCTIDYQRQPADSWTVAGPPVGGAIFSVGGRGA